MEKKKAHYNLIEIKNLIRAGNFRLTKVARTNAIVDFDYTEEHIIDAVLKLEPCELYKSMTSNSNSQIWQDVYHKSINKMQIAYIKLQMLDNETVIIQFKQK